MASPLGQASQPPPASPSPPRMWLAFAAYAALLIAYHSIEASVGALVRSAVGGLGFVPLNLAAIYWLWRAAGSPSLAPGEREGLRGLAVMFGLTLAGNVGYGFDSLVRHRDPTYGWTNIPYLLTYPVGAYALARFPHAASGPAAGRTLLLDMAGLVVAAGALVWTFVIVPVDLALAPVALATTLAYPLAAMLLLAFVGRLLLVQATNSEHRHFLLLGAALFVQCVADLVLALDFDDARSLASTWSAVVAPVTYVVIIGAAERASAHRPDASACRPVTPGAATLLPLIGTMTVYTALIWAAESGRGAAFGPLVLAALAMNVLLLVKQAGAAAENGRLMAAQAEAESRARFEALALEGQKLEAVGRLAAGVAHDFNNLLTTVLANAELALERLPRGHGAHDEVTDIRGAARRGAELVRQLLAYSRKSVVAPVRISPGVVVRDVERLMQRLAGDQHPLRIDLPHGLGAVQVDRGQLEQVLANLISNARDAMPEGGPIRVTGENVMLDHSMAEPLALNAGNYVSLAVRDTGIGLPPEVRRHIFEPFFSTKGVGKGTGLGLASSYGIMRQSRGAIGVESEPGRGSCFTLYFPRADAPSDPVVPAHLTPTPSPTTSRSSTPT